MKLELARQIFEKGAHIKIRPLTAKLFHAEGRTYMTKLTVGFRNFGNALKNMPLSSERRKPNYDNHVGAKCTRTTPGAECVFGKDTK
jgi:hypothetical protein